MRTRISALIEFKERGDTLRLAAQLFAPCIAFAVSSFSFAATILL